MVTKGVEAMTGAPQGFRYARPSTLAAALNYLTEDRAIILAGGQTLIPRLASGLESPGVLVDLGGLGQLRRIEGDAGGVTIGAMVRLAEAAKSAVLKEHAPLLVDCVEKTATPAIRNRGTLVGNLACADPASQLPVVAVALNAVFRLERLSGARLVPAESFFIGPNATAAQADEIITHVSFDAAAAAALTFVALRQNSRALATAVVVVSLDRANRIERASIAVGGCGDVPRRCRSVEAKLAGLPHEAAADRAAQALIADPPSRGRGVLDADYAIAVLPALLRRAVGQACARAVGD
jgi:carbon-monoxide dehydrogenase medium subunit